MNNASSIRTIIIYAGCCQDAPEPYGTSDSISLPVYASDARDRVVTSFILPCGGNKGQWLQSGAALFLRTQ